MQIAMAYEIRPIASLEELEVALEIISAQSADAVRPDERRFRDALQRFPRYRDVMLVAVAEGRIVGGVIGYGPADGPVTGFSLLVKALGVAAAHRGTGLGRRLMAEVEAAAAAMGAVEVHLGAVPSARGFYARLGYDGRSRMRKSLTGTGALRYGAAEERTRRVAELRRRRAERLSHNACR